MRVIKYLIGFSILLLSCNTNNQDTGAKNEDPLTNDSLAVQDSLSVFIDSLTKDNFEIVFDETKSSLVIKLTKEPQRTIPIGSYHNTFNQPPHEIKIEDLGNQNYAILVFTNQVQMGISEDQINAFRFNLASKKVDKVCSFEGLGIYSEEEGIDTLIDIKLYDYRLTRVKEAGDFKIEVLDYKPFRYQDENRNKGLNIKTVKKECTFTVSK